MFAHRLAERLGRTVRELEHSMSNREYQSWVALALHDQIEQEKAERDARSKARR